MVETDATGTMLKEYVWDDEGRPLAQIVNGVISYLHPDHLGSPRLGTDSGKNVVWQWQDVPFGVAAPTGSITVALRYPGQYHEAETGLFQNWNRTYHSSSGRYLESDLIGLGGGNNTYFYAGASPLKYIDPRGLETQYSVADLAIVESHLKSIASLQGDDFNSSQSFAPERAMLDRLKRGMDSSFDIGFLRHERLEADICKQKFKGLNPKKLSPEEIQRSLREAHDETLATQSNRSSDLYHPNVLAKYPRWVW